jgi:hypothetical protein
VGNARSRLSVPIPQYLAMYSGMSDPQMSILGRVIADKTRFRREDGFSALDEYVAIAGLPVQAVQAPNQSGGRASLYIFFVCVITLIFPASSTSMVKGCQTRCRASSVLPARKT